MALKEATFNLLNKQQIMMMRLLRTPTPQADFVPTRRLAVKFLSKQLDESMEEWEAQNGITTEAYEEMAKGHFRSSSMNTYQKEITPNTF
jgi:hypothetical protein